ncbi:MAG TPA: ribonuclease H [Armatimonadetes bacterium]|jgi:ribonuclease HI|nr:ribonuclease H [Armatimonadota bacterium]
MELEPTTAVLYTDGASKGNPGPAGAGFVLSDTAGRTLASAGIPLGVTTNNVAEYRGLIGGLEAARELGVTVIHVRSDSELMCRQLGGQYRVKSARLRPLFEQARRLLGEFDTVRIEHVRREFNELADRLASDAAKASGRGRGESHGTGR